MDLVPREDFERLEAMVIKLREEQEELKKQFPQKKKATAKKKAAPKRATKNAPAKKTKKASKQMSTERDLLQNSTNPIDNVEDILLENNWVFERMSNDNLAVSVKGKSCNYHLYFIWQEDMSALQFCCQYDFLFPPISHFATLKTLTNVNKDLWMGHFDIPETTKILASATQASCMAQAETIVRLN